ncbi:MAG TPA: hypothetical protein VGO95_02550 [Modestobacter sp.]|jgi:ABC-2 type transport system permease protein|nr:hypothetical protein [Modestobacter sp.]
MSRSRPYSNAAALSWFGWQVPVGVQLLTVAVITIGLIGLAARMFRTTE